MTAIHDMTAGELLAAYKTKKLSPVEATDAVIAHIEAWEPKLKALYAPDFEGARKAAKAAEKRWQAGTPQGALDGVPITIKENIATKGVPVPLGTAATELVPAADRCAGLGAGARSRGGDPRPRPPCPTTACSPRAAAPSIRSRAIPGTSPGIPAAPARARARPRPPATAPCISAPTSAARCACRPRWNGIFTLKPSLGRVPVDPPFFGRADRTDDPHAWRTPRC